MHTSALLVTTPNMMMWTGCLVFINMNVNQFLYWHLNTMKSLYWSFQCEWQAVQSAAYKFLEDWIMSCCCFVHRQYSTDSSLLHSRQNLKQIKHLCKIDILKIARWGGPCGVMVKVLDCRIIVSGFKLQLLY